MTGLFQAVSDGSDPSSHLSSKLDDSTKSIIAASIPKDAEPTIEGLDKSMTTSTATVKAKLSSGGELTYTVTFEREGIGWAVSGVSTDFSGTSTSE